MVCRVHGGAYGSSLLAGCITRYVLDDVRAERARQFAKYGPNEDLEDGTGAAWIPRNIDEQGRSALFIENSFRVDYEKYEAVYGKPTWLHLVREEVAEAFEETDPSRLYDELIQVAALAVSWCEKIKARETRPS